MKTNSMTTQATTFGPVQIGIVLLALATAAIHISLLFPNAMFILNGLGFMGLLALYFLPIPFARQNRGLIRWLFIGYTAITILAWVAIGEKSWPEGALGYVSKAIEVGLIALLWLDGRRGT